MEILSKISLENSDRNFISLPFTIESRHPFINIGKNKNIHNHAENEIKGCFSDRTQTLHVSNASESYWPGVP